MGFFSKQRYRYRWMVVVLVSNCGISPSVFIYLG